MKSMQYDDALRAKDWGLDASFLETKMDSSVLVCLCQAFIEAKALTEEDKKLFDWAMMSGAQMRYLQVNSVLFFQLAAISGAAWIWRRLMEEGYALDKVVAKVTNSSLASSSSSSGNSRVTSKLGLLCSPPYCFSHELSDLIGLLISGGVDPNERDSDGYAPLGRLNEQLRQHEANHLAIDKFVPSLVKGVSILLDQGANMEGLLPAAETFAAKAIQGCIRAKKEKLDLLQHIIIPEHKNEALRTALRSL